LELRTEVGRGNRPTSDRFSTCAPHRRGGRSRNLSLYPRRTDQSARNTQEEDLMLKQRFLIGFTAVSIAAFGLTSVSYAREAEPNGDGGRKEMDLGDDRGADRLIEVQARDDRGVDRGQHERQGEDHGIDPAPHV